MKPRYHLSLSSKYCASQGIALPNNGKHDGCPFYFDFFSPLFLFLFFFLSLFSSSPLIFFLHAIPFIHLSSVLFISFQLLTVCFTLLKLHQSKLVVNGVVVLPVAYLLTITFNLHPLLVIIHPQLRLLLLYCISIDTTILSKCCCQLLSAGTFVLPSFMWSSELSPSVPSHLPEVLCRLPLMMTTVIRWTFAIPQSLLSIMHRMLNIMMTQWTSATPQPLTRVSSFRVLSPTDLFCCRL